MVKKKIRIKIRPYIRRVRTRLGRRQRVIRGHKRSVIRVFGGPAGKRDFGSLKFLPKGKQKGLSILNQQLLEEIRSTKNKRQLTQIQEEILSSNLTPKQKSSLIRIGEAREELRFPSLKNFGSQPNSIEDQIRKRTELILMGSDTLHPFEARQKAINELIDEGIIRKPGKKNFGSFGGIRDIERFKDINKMILKRKEIILMGSDTLSPETARKMAKDQLVIEGKIKKSELKNRGSSPTTGTAKPSDILLIESLQKNKQLQKKKDRDNIYELSVDKGGWFK